jgi:hypothetical protein
MADAIHAFEAPACTRQDQARCVWKIALRVFHPTVFQLFGFQL